MCWDQLRLLKFSDQALKEIMPKFKELEVMASNLTKALVTDEFKQTFNTEAILNDILALGSGTANLKNTINKIEKAESNFK
jgi:hypothetical protein